MTFESAKLLAASTSAAIEWYKSCAHTPRSCPKLFKFLCGPTQRERDKLFLRHKNLLSLSSMSFLSLLSDVGIAFVSNEWHNDKEDYHCHTYNWQGDGHCKKKQNMNIHFLFKVVCVYTYYDNPTCASTCTISQYSIVLERKKERERERETDKRKLLRLCSEKNCVVCKWVQVSLHSKLKVEKKDVQWERKVAHKKSCSVGEIQNQCPHGQAWFARSISPPLPPPFLAPRLPPKSQQRFRPNILLLQTAVCEGDNEYTQHALLLLGDPPHKTGYHTLQTQRMNKYMYNIVSMSNCY